MAGLRGGETQQARTLGLRVLDLCGGSDEEVGSSVELSERSPTGCAVHLATKSCCSRPAEGHDVDDGAKGSIVRFDRLGNRPEVRSEGAHPGGIACNRRGNIDRWHVAGTFPISNGFELVANRHPPGIDRPRASEHRSGGGQRGRSAPCHSSKQPGSVPPAP